MTSKYLAQKKVSPIPILPISVGAVDQRPFNGPFDAVVDTGADLTIFPTAILHRIKARSTGDGQMRSAFGDVHAVTFFLVDLQVDGNIFPAVLVAGERSVQEITLGRNVLNKLALLLDGPEQQAQTLNEQQLRRLRAKS